MDAWRPSTKNVLRSALSLILPHVDGTTIGKHPTVCWLIKGAYERNPPRPKYEVFWDVNKVFTMFKEWATNSSLSLKHLTWKLAVLLLLVTSQRGQTILNLSIKNLELANPVVFKMQKLLKHNRLGDPLDCITLQRFPECPKLCVVRTLKTYLKRTSKIRKDDQLLLAYVQPHRAISRDTLARWTLVVLQQAGVNTKAYKGHSIRGATTSAARCLGVPLNVIMRHAGWRNAMSFATYYNKKVEQESTLARTLLNNAL